jgi:hypothetical protein
MKGRSECQRCWQDGRTLHNGFYLHRGQADRHLQDDRRSNLLLPLPGLSFPPLLREEIAAERKRNAAQRHLSGWVSGTSKGAHFTRRIDLELDGPLTASSYTLLKAYLKTSDPDKVEKGDGGRKRESLWREASALGDNRIYGSSLRILGC